MASKTEDPRHETITPHLLRGSTLLKYSEIHRIAPRANVTAPAQARTRNRLFAREQQADAKATTPQELV